MDDLAEALSRELRGEVRFDAWTRTLFSRDASMYAIEPLGVVFPYDADDVAAAVSVAAEHGVPVLPRGAGTSLAGQTVGRAVVMDLSRHLHRILEIDADAGWARVQPGVVQDDLNRAAGRFGLMFGPDTSTSNRATLGGMIGNNSAGSHSIRYGMTIDHVLALDAVLSDASRARLRPVEPDAPARLGRSETLEGALYRELPRLVERHRDAIANGFPRFWRRAGGYRLDRLLDGGRFDLARFVVGSEGTLVTVTEALVRLVPTPRHQAIAVGHFSSTEAAIAATEDALACDPAAVELMDRTILDLSRRRIDYAELGSILSGEPDALLFVTFFGDSQAEAIGGLDRLEARWRRHRHGYHTLRAVTRAEQAALLKVRRAGLGLLMAASVGTRRPLAFVEDTAVEPADLPAYVARFRQILDRHGLAAGFYGHCSVGCLHIRPFLDLTRPAEVATMRAVAEEVLELVIEYGGVSSSEHGDGLARSEFNRRVFGDELYGAMRAVKRLFDPDGRMNPGKIVDAPPMTEHLRDPNLPVPSATPTRLRFGVDGGMLGAADRCMNIGLCRKGATGTMCPSYMATREEEHATRGRANALVKALTAPEPLAALSERRLVLLARALGIAAERPLPRFRRDTLLRWFRRRPSPRGPFPRGEVVFLADSFTTFTEPEVGIAAIELLERAGWRVRLEAAGCCGRASLSKGLLDQAREMAAGMVARLAPAARQGAPIVGAEPSCLLMLRDDYAALLPGDPAARDVAASARLVEELLVEAVESGDLPLRPDAAVAGRRILFHGHCHQKALVGTAATVRLLECIPGAEVVEVDAGCCGMAGSFGFEAEHYELSLRIGGLRLFPAVLAQPAGTLLAATGVSCRQQIAHGAGRPARHPVELVRAAAGNG